MAEEDAFLQEEPLTTKSGAAFFGSQTFCAIDKPRGSHGMQGLYILPPEQ